MTDQRYILETIGLTKGYGGVRAIDGVDLQLQRGELRCLIGPNGAGKSTFFKMLSAQINPSAGRIMFDGQDITDVQPYVVSHLGIGIKNQVPAVFDNLSVQENIWLAGHALDPAHRETATRDMLDRLGLSRLAAAKVGGLAHGHRQWVELGMVLMLSPRLILLDEPTAGMTEEETDRVVELIHEANKTSTIIVVEHDMKFVRKIAQTVTVFHQGRVFAEGTIAEIMANAAVRDIYLGRSADA